MTNHDIRDTIETIKQNERRLYMYLYKGIVKYDVESLKKGDSIFADRFRVSTVDGEFIFMIHNYTDIEVSAIYEYDYTYKKYILKYAERS